MESANKKMNYKILIKLTTIKGRTHAYVKNYYYFLNIIKFNYTRLASAKIINVFIATRQQALIT